MRYVITFCLLLFWFNSYGQIPQVRKLNFEFEYQQLKVSRIHADRSGYIWMGTQIGLFRHDGVNVDFISFADSNDVDQITVIQSAENGALFIGTKRGRLFQLKDAKLVGVPGFKNPHKNAIQCIDLDAQQNIWVGTTGAGVLVVRDGLQTELNSKWGLPDNNVNAIKNIGGKQIWIGTDAGVCVAKWEADELEIVVPSSKIKLDDPFVTVIEKGEPGEVFIGTQSGSIYRHKNNLVKPLFLSSMDRNIGAIVDMKYTNKKLWIASENKGLLSFEDGVLEEGLNHSNSLVPDKIIQITTDREGSIWLADKTENVFMVNDLFSFISSPQLKAAPIQAIATDLIGGLWYSNANGTFLFKRGKNIELPPTIATIKAICIYPDSNGNIWLGTFGNGVYCYNPHQKKTFKFDEKSMLANNNVISISGDGKYIWLATFAGISIAEMDKLGQANFKFESAQRKFGLPNSYYYQVFIDSKGNVWFGSDGEGLSVLSKGKLISFLTEKKMEARIINSICEDAFGSVWFNSPEDGLYRFKQNSFTKFGTKAGIREIGYNSICADNFNNLIVVNSRGIDMLNIQNLNILYHDKEIGFVGKAKESRVSVKDIFGRIWIGAGSQVIVYNPQANLLWKGPEPTLKSANVFLTPFEMVQGKEFSYKENYISFDYVGIWYHLPEEVNYLIKLEGYDPDWVKSRNLTVTYPQLPPGKYVFRVKALPSNNFKSDKELTYAFTIRKPYYQTWWFIGMLLLSTGFLVYLGFNWRISQLREKEKMNSDRIQFQYETLRSQVNPHFLFNSFNTLSGLIEKNTSDAVQYVEHLSDFFRNILQYKDKNLVPLSDELAILNDYINIQQKRFGDGFKVNIEEGLKSQNMYIAPMTLQILLENSIKHNIVSKSQPLEVNIYLQEPDYVCISNPIQLKKRNEKSTQIGLSNIINRYHILQSRKVIVEDQDSKFVVKIPLISHDTRTHS